jgi:putative transposase
VPGHTARMADADGRALVLQAHSADLQDCDGASRCSRPRARRPLRRTGLRRQRLPRRTGQPSNLDRHRGGQEVGRSGRVRRPAKTLGRRALLRLDQPKPLPRQGLRGHFASAETFLYAASVMLLARRLAQS